MPSIDRPDPPYLQVVRHIQGQITSGELKVGDTVPSVRQISEEWGIARPTATKAITTLASEGWIDVRPGVRAVVRDRSLHRSAQDHVSLATASGRIYPAGHYAEILDAGTAEAPEHITEAFGASAGKQLIRRLRTTYNDQKEPVSTSASWFSGALVDAAPRLLVAERIVQGTTLYALERAGHGDRAFHVEVMYAAGTATEDEAKQLRIDTGAAVQRTRNFFRDDQGELIELGESVYRQGVWSWYRTAPTTPATKENPQL
ncbi:GntR family transcriptional regulator [Amycolatopsis sp. NPDC004079]|uniref:GntR family transcriptional regulator n=1 Tax=Amycolatopsis sp. NPDC004079 TaxID=3154549 RepID=UPI0033B3B333